MAYGDCFEMIKNFCFCTIITSPLIPGIHIGILIHFVWIHLIRASVKSTLEWPKTIFRFYWMLYSFRQLLSVHKEQCAVEWKGFA